MAAVSGVIIFLTFALFSSVGSERERIMLGVIFIEVFAFWYFSLRAARQRSKRPSEQETADQREMRLLRSELDTAHKLSGQYSSALWSLRPKLERAEARAREYEAAVERCRQERDALRREVEGFRGGRDPAALEAELARCRGWQAEWRRRAEKAEAALARDGDARGARLFQLAKRRFAERYHPDKVRGGRLEKQIHHEVFTDVWKIFEDVEKGG
jgi:chromosome segregation ATPase